MTKNLKSQEVIRSIERKIQLKKDLRLAKEESDNDSQKAIQKKIIKIDEKLHSAPLSKS
jgi:hypothetical protein